MGANYYIENDGTIHSKPVSNEGAITESPAVSRAYGDPSYNPAEHQISKLRVGAFWTISIIFSVLPGIGSYLLIGELLFGTAEEASSFWASVWAWVGPYALIVSSVSGCALYGACCAEERDYDLGTYFFSVLSALAGVMLVSMAVAGLQALAGVFIWIAKILWEFLKIFFGILFIAALL